MMNRILVIDRCSKCWHAAYSPSEGWVCMAHPEAWSPLPAGHTVPMPDEPIPDWCPLQRADEVARVKPLEWCESYGHGVVAHEAEAAGISMAIEGKGGRWHWALGGLKWQPCDSLEAGKAACEAHYRAALFGPQGPLAKL